MKSTEQILKSLRITNGKFKLSTFSTLLPERFQEHSFSKENLEIDIQGIAKIQNKLFAEDRQTLLIILQGMDSSGKDGTIKHIMKGVNPQGIEVTSFKHPSTQELEHDYLWRHIIKLPEHGQIVLFNRSHYENVLISKVHPEFVLSERIIGLDKLSKVDSDFWEQRYNQIRYFEKSMIQNGTQILKFFLHISRDEQGRRFLDRINNANKHWKFSSNDIEERKYWDKYQEAYEQAIRKTSTKSASWYVIPADDKPVAHALIGKIILDKLKEMNPILPTKSKEEEKYMKKAKVDLEKELKECRIRKD